MQSPAGQAEQELSPAQQAEEAMLSPLSRDEVASPASAAGSEEAMHSPLSALASLRAREAAGKLQAWRPRQEDTAFRLACLARLLPIRPGSAVRHHLAARLHVDWAGSAAGLGRLCCGLD